MRAVFNRSTEAEHRYLNTTSEIFCEEINFSKIFNVDAFLAALKLTTGRLLFFLKSLFTKTLNSTKIYTYVSRENQQSACDLCLTTSFNILQAKQSALSVRVAPLNVSNSCFILEITCTTK